MEITKVVKPFSRRGANTFGNIVYTDRIQHLQRWIYEDMHVLSGVMSSVREISFKSNALQYCITP